MERPHGFWDPADKRGQYREMLGGTLRSVTYLVSVVGSRMGWTAALSARRHAARIAVNAARRYCTPVAHSCACGSPHSRGSKYHCGVVKSRSGASEEHTSSCERRSERRDSAFRPKALLTC